jgi:hypothetical protein
MKRENKARRFPGTNGPRPDLSKLKKEEAKERQEAYDKLSIGDKISLLDSRLGVGQGAKKQRVRLEGLLKTPPVIKQESMPATEAPATASATESDKHKIKAKDRRKLEQKKFQEEGNE